MAFFDLQIPFFKPLWRRLVLLSVCFVWAALEFYNGESGWGALFVALGLLAAYQLFFAGWPKPNSDSHADSGSQNEDNT